MLDTSGPNVIVAGAISEASTTVRPATSVTPHIAAIGVATPAHDIHQAFVAWAEGRLHDHRQRRLFQRMVERAGIDHRWSILTDPAGFYAGPRPPGTKARMEAYAAEAPRLAIGAVGRLQGAAKLNDITHLVVASCTGFVAPGVDQLLAAELGLADDVERTLIGFMGCYAAVAALRAAAHIVRSTPEARVLVITVELCSLHLQEESELEPLLAALLFGDGAAAAVVCAEPGGFALSDFFSRRLPNSDDLIRWTIGDHGFAMHLSGQVPGRIHGALSNPEFRRNLFGDQPSEAFDAWAIHAGGRSVLDAVETALGLEPQALAVSRGVLRDVGNMSCSTLMFILARYMEIGAKAGLAVAFGPGLAAEGFRFRSAG